MHEYDYYYSYNYCIKVHFIYKYVQIFNFIITGGYDYESKPFNVTIPAGEISVPFNISIIEDNIFETTETFIFTIDSSSLPSRVLLQSDCMLMITIVDDDGKLK